MSTKTEKILYDLQKYLDSHEDCDLGELNKCNILHFSDNRADRTPDAYDLLEMAEKAETELEAIKYAKKALALDPDLLDADLLIVQRKNREFEPLQKQLEKLLKKGEKQLQKCNISIQDDAGDFYGLLETRPYMRVYYSYVQTLIIQSKFRKATEACEELLRLNPNDNLGIRYHLMALYATLEEQEALEKLYKKYNKDYSAFMILPCIALYYKLDNRSTAKRYITKLCNNIEGVRQALEMIKSDDDITNIVDIPYYRPFSQEELIMAYESSPYLYEPMFGFLSWFISQCPDNTSSKT